MTIIHTADWHIGQHFYGYDRSEEHQLFFSWLIETIVEREVTLLLVAGDIFDNPNPSATAQKLYYSFLKELNKARPTLQIVITAGNHDSAARLEAPAPLLEGFNVTVKGVVEKDKEGSIEYQKLIVPIEKEGEVIGAVLAVPYLRQGDYPASESYSSGISLFYQELYNVCSSIEQYKEKPIIAMGHLQATGSQLIEDDRWERTIIGGLEAVTPHSFDTQLYYTALGHLHRAQRVDKRERVRYAGSPLPFSFSEKHYKHGVTLIKGDTIEQLPFPSPAKLITLPKRGAAPLSTILEKIGELEEGPKSINSPYLKINIELDGGDTTARHQIEEALEGKSVKLTTITSHFPTTEGNKERYSEETLEKLTPLKVAKDFWKREHGGEPLPKELEKLFIEAIAQVEKEEE